MPIGQILVANSNIRTNSRRERLSIDRGHYGCEIQTKSLNMNWYSYDTLSLWCESDSSYQVTDSMMNWRITHPIRRVRFSCWVLDVVRRRDRSTVHLRNEIWARKLRVNQSLNLTWILWMSWWLGRIENYLHLRSLLNAAVSKVMTVLSWYHIQASLALSSFSIVECPFAVVADKTSRGCSSIA